MSPRKPAKHVNTGQNGDELRVSQEHLETVVREREQAEAAFRAIVDTAQDAIISIDDDDHITFWNHSAARLFGYEENAALGRKLTELIIPARYRQAHQKGLMRFLNTRKPRLMGKTTEMVACKKGGAEFPVAFSLATWVMDDRVFFTSIIRDITSRKQAEADLEKHRAHLEELVSEKTRESQSGYANQSLINALLMLSIEEASLEKLAADALELILSASWLNVEPQGALFLSENGRLMALKAAVGLPPPLRSAVESVPFNECPFGRSVAEGKTEFAADLGAVHRAAHEGVSDKGYICLPIKSVGVVIGALLIFLPRGIERERINEEFLSVVANTLAGIVRHRRSLEELEHKRAALIEQNRATAAFLGILEVTAASQNFTEAVNKLLPLIARLTDCRSCSVYFVDETDHALHPTHSWGLSKEPLANFISHKPDLREVNEFLALSGRETAFIDDLSKTLTPPSLKEHLRHLKAKAAILMPIVYEGDLQALMILAYPRVRAFTARDKEIAVKLGKHLEASHTDFRHSHDLLQQTMKLAQQLEMIEAMTGIDRAILSSANREEIIYGAVERFGRAVASDAVEILEFDEERDRFVSAAVHDADGTHFSPETVVDQARLKSWDHVIFGSASYYPDLSREELGDLYESRFKAQGYKSLLVLPLLSKGDVLGMVTIASNRAAFFVPAHLVVAQRLGNQIAVALSNTGLVRDLQAVLVGTVNSLVTTLDAKSPWTRGHSRRVCKYALELGRALELDDSQMYELELATLFHDIGKIGTYDVVLDKKAKLTEEEYSLIKQHPGKTREILMPIPRLKEIADIAGHHHERWDARGYPDGLAEEDIPYLSRITALADSYDAMTSDRPYRKGLTKKAALDEIAKNAGSQFDPELAHVFVNVMREYGESPAQKRAA